ncbi:indoleamine 2,3-dioxygenase 1 isoform X3 [Gadus macrocephalus]|uniref:indoleamine 2,3-dioxygenase 1 isoform X3 n=1 Tax=Gadus macrocephalus TaxID=80720 RepID=UPI0028CB9F99|nr:indoleamine 2,3-dioxygenase 1 isoform X3 [Gadus macrocephalus]
MALCSTEPKVPFSLEPYHVSTELGFVLPAPLQELPEYYRPWMEIAFQVSDLVQSHTLRSRIDKMPLLSTEYLQSHRELRLAHLALSAMTMGYVWQEGEEGTIQKLPRTLAVPFWEVSRSLGLPPILTHADAVLANWRKKDLDGNLELLVSLPGGDSVRGFFLVTLLVELAAVPALRSIPAVVNGVRRGDGEAVADALEVLQQSLQDMRDTLKLLHDTHQVEGQPLHAAGPGVRGRGAGARGALRGQCGSEQPAALLRPAAGGAARDRQRTLPGPYEGLHAPGPPASDPGPLGGALSEGLRPGGQPRPPGPRLRAVFEPAGVPAERPHQRGRPLHQRPRRTGPPAPLPGPHPGRAPEPGARGPGGEGHRGLGHHDLPEDGEGPHQRRQTAGEQRGAGGAGRRL